MRETLSNPSLARQAGRFVWLELDFDRPENAAFLARHGVSHTPSLFIVDPAGERVIATNIGGLTLPELDRYLDRGERAVVGAEKDPADAALAAGDEQIGRGMPAGAAASYRKALQLAGADGPGRDRAIRSLTWALMLAGDVQRCAETAVAETPKMPRGPEFAGAVLSGLMCANQGQDAAWAGSARKSLEPLAEEAVAVPDALRDHRFQLYQQLMYEAMQRGDRKAVFRWGESWLKEIESTTPAGDDERSALDIARVDAVGILGDPERALPALRASEKAMPDNYNASLRLAQTAAQAGHTDEALAACDRGLARVTGPIGRTWLLQTKAQILIDRKDPAAARKALEEALQAARAIGPKMNREGNIQRITQALASLGKPAK